MRMKRKRTAAFMALIMSVMAVNTAGAEDFILSESEMQCGVTLETTNVPEEVPVAESEILLQETDEQDMETYQEADPGETELSGSEVSTESTELPEPDESVSDSEEDSGAVQMWNSADELVLAIETVEPETEAEPETEQLPQEIQGTVCESGRASDAFMPRLRAFRSGSYTDSYGSQLEGRAKLAYDSMVDAYVQKSGTGAVEVNLGVDTVLQYATRNEYEEVDMEVDYMVQAAYDAFKYDYPEVFWMGLVSYGAVASRQNIDGSKVYVVSTVRITPKEDYAGASDEMESFRAAVDGTVSQISSGLAAGSTTRDKVQAVHDYICSIAAYDDSYNAYTQDDPRKAYAHSSAGIFLKEKKVVCEGYAKAFKILCAKFGIECILVTGDAGGGHMWNYVRMEDGNWYLVDTTWDDQKTGTIYTYFLAGSLTQNSSGMYIGEERLIYLNFSPSDYTATFAVPVLNSYSYDQEHPMHTHTWSSVEKKEPTCQEEGYEILRCECGEVTLNIFDKTEHSFRSTTVYNQDATCISDGTKTYYCDYGCGTAGRTVAARGTKLAPSVSQNLKSIRLKKGQSTGAFLVSGLGPGDYVKSWSTTKSSVVRVEGKTDGTCVITAQKKTGTAQIVATLASGLEAKLSVRVQSKAVAATRISGILSRLTLKKKKTYQLSPVIAPVTCVQKVTYSSSNKKVAAVSKKGKITARKKGKAVITVRCGSKTKKCTVTVK